MHWHPPESRGLYQQPGNTPPAPQPHESNNITSRLVRIETYLQYAVHDRMRAEWESRARDYDLHDRLLAIEATVTGWTDNVQASSLIAKWGVSAAKYIAAVILFAMWAANGLPWDSVKAGMSVIGLPIP